MNEGQDFVCHRLVIRGALLVPQALHIGSGEPSIKSDAAIRRDGGEQPYIPGSTLGGLLRATATDFAPYLFANWRAAIDGLFGRAGGERNAENNASRVVVEDAFLLTPLPSASEVRDYVGIDRRKGVARPHLQYDREVVPSNTSYSFEISVEEPTQDEILLLLAVLDFWSEFDFALHIGGRTTTGLGKAKLDRNSLVFYNLDFSNPTILLDYLCPSGEEPQHQMEYLPEAARVCRNDIEPVTGQLHTPQDNNSHAEAFFPQHLFLTVALTLEEPLLVQGSVPEIPEAGASLYGENRTSDADFVTALTTPVDEEGKLAKKEYIPGSSLKGVFRTRAEKIIRTLNFHRGNTDASTNAGYKAAKSDYKERICACAITHSEKDNSLPEDFREPCRLLSCFGAPDKQRRAQQVNRRFLNSYSRRLYIKSCLTCRMFGNSLMRGRLHVSDAELTVEPQPKLFDHVAINRFHGGAEDKRKFDTRPLMPQVSEESQAGSSSAFQPMFKFDLHLERPDPWMLGLLGHLLKDLNTADIHIGSATHRGYGKVSGSVTSAELLVLPGAQLEELCKEKKLLPEEATERERLGPYWRIALELRRLFGTEKWETNGLTVVDALQTPTARLLEECNRQFQKLVEREEEKPHGNF